MDSLEDYLNLAEVALKKGSYAKAITLYKHSARLATANEPSEQQRLHDGLAISYFRTKDYQSAIGHYAALGSLNNEQMYQRALCYLRLGRKSEALSDLFRASEAGNKSAAQMYEKENPLIKKILYYQTVCCDGGYSPSNAKGRGACSPWRRL
ncbi:MAG: tetratricopeptide repeat protein [Spirosomataceae bacterium]